MTTAEDRALEERKLAEKEFANVRYVEEVTVGGENRTNKRWYSIVNGPRGATAYLDNWLKENTRGKRVLDYCCGKADHTFKIAAQAQEVCGIDISEAAVDICRQRAANLGLTNTRFDVMDAEHTDFPDNYFDIIHVNGVLHHLDLDAAYKELARVLKPDGKIICEEALVHNPLFQLYRRRTPDIRTVWEVDHILGRSTIRKSLNFFDGLDITFFHLAGLLAVPLRKTPIFKPMMSAMAAVDSVILRIPGLKWWAWIGVFILTKPKKTTN